MRNSLHMGNLVTNRPRENSKGEMPFHSHLSQNHSSRPALRLTGKARIRGALFSDKPENISRVWSGRHLQRLEQWVELPKEIITRQSLEEHRDWLAETEVIFSTWGMPSLSSAELALLPRLRAVFYAAGTVKHFAPPLWERGIVIANAAAANAMPVAEFTLAQILFSLKQGWQHVRDIQERHPAGKWNRLQVPGVYNATVGIISLGLIGSRVCDLLRHFILRKIAYDPYVCAEQTRALGASPATLKQIFCEGDVVTLHAPWLPETEGMITGELLASMKPGATFINTARGILVREDEMVEVLRQRQDLTAFLDVTYPEPPHPDSPLYSLPNVIITPHIAGSMGMEVFRMADLMIEEFQAWYEGRPLRYEATPETELAGA